MLKLSRTRRAVKISVVAGLLIVGCSFLALEIGTARGQIRLRSLITRQPAPSAEPTMSDLVRMLDNRRDGIRRQAADCLAAHGADARPALPALQRALHSSEGATKVCVARAILGIDPRDRAAVAALLVGLRDHDEETRWIAAQALAKASGDYSLRVVPELTAIAQRDANPTVREVAQASLNYIANGGRVDERNTAPTQLAQRETPSGEQSALFEQPANAASEVVTATEQTSSDPATVEPSEEFRPLVVAAAEPPAIPHDELVPVPETEPLPQASRAQIEAIRGGSTVAPSSREIPAIRTRYLSPVDRLESFEEREANGETAQESAPVQPPQPVREEVREEVKPQRVIPQAETVLEKPQSKDVFEAPQQENIPEIPQQEIAQEYFPRQSVLEAARKTVAEPAAEPMPENVTEPEQVTETERESVLERATEYDPQPVAQPASLQAGTQVPPSAGVPMGVDDGYKPITAVNTSIAPKEGDLPQNPGLARFPKARDLRFPAGTNRGWGLTPFTWEADGTYHDALYFEEVNVERYGYHRKLIQPVISGGRFFATAPFLPYLVTAQPPCRPIYTLGHYRPGDCVPYQIHRPPFSWKGAVVQGAAITGLAFLIP